MESLAHVTAFVRPSSLQGSRLCLATAALAEGPEPFLRARVHEPRRVAMAMRLVSDVVRSRHHVPAAMLERILREADPVLTYGDGVLRVEGFSGCCGIYARADISAAALDLDQARHGTTNVDFNDGMRAALSRVRDQDPMELEVGQNGVAVNRVVERRVDLPSRWLRGFGEVQAIQQRMVPAFELDRARATRFLRGLPRSGKASVTSYVVPHGRSVRLGGSPVSNAVPLAGVSRLRALELFLPVVRRLVVHVDPTSGASAWRLEGGSVALTAVLSAAVWRGFSGEGQLLSQLAAEARHIAAVRSRLAWQATLTADALAADTDVPLVDVERALAWLASRGLVGFDVARQAWFHRELPFDRERAAKLFARTSVSAVLSEPGAGTGCAPPLQGNAVDHPPALHFGDEVVFCLTVQPNRIVLDDLPRIAEPRVETVDHDRLDVSADERSERRGRYLRLLESVVPATT
ncbi:MAG: hypothetical protein AAGA56_25985, partial [Myxococcota bacterium]